MVLETIDLHALLGGQPITLIPTDNGELEAEMTGDYAVLVRLIEVTELVINGGMSQL